jgi:hypothetical protein
MQLSWYHGETGRLAFCRHIRTALEVLLRHNSPVCCFFHGIMLASVQGLSPLDMYHAHNWGTIPEVDCGTTKTRTFCQELHPALPHSTTKSLQSSGYRHLRRRMSARVLRKYDITSHSRHYANLELFSPSELLPLRLPSCLRT